MTRLVEECAKRRVPYTELSIRSGVDVRTIYRIASAESKGRTVGLLETWERLADALGCDLYELIRSRS